MESKAHLPVLGVGPIYVVTISFVTFAIVVMDCVDLIPTIEFNSLFVVLFRLVSILFLLIGLVLWVGAVFFNRITGKIKQNRLVTDGVYAYVRHPIYSAFTFVEWGILLWFCNPYYFVLIPVYWMYFTFLIKNTEEKWLTETFGQEYEIYHRKVNRCIPWFKKKQRNNYICKK